MALPGDPILTSNSTVKTRAFGQGFGGPFKIVLYRTDSPSTGPLLWHPERETLAKWAKDKSDARTFDALVQPERLIGAVHNQLLYSDMPARKGRDFEGRRYWMAA